MKPTPEKATTPSGSARNLPRVRLRLLGQPSLELPDGSSLALTDKDAFLFTVLALRGPIPSANLAKLLWPDRPLKSSQTNLRQRLFKFKQVLGTSVTDSDAQGLKLAACIAHELAEPVAALRSDCHALSGKLLGELHCAYSTELATLVDDERKRWSDRLPDILAQVATEHEDKGQIAKALPCALRLVELDPLREHSVRLLMRLHHRRGDRGAALAAFEQCRVALYEALGEQPAQETLALAVAIGEQQVAGVATASTLPLSLRHPPALAGREELMQRATERWQDSGCVLLVGEGGIGKSRLLDALSERWQVSVRCELLPGDGNDDLRLLGRIAAALLERPSMFSSTQGRSFLELMQWLAGTRQGPAQPALQPDQLAAFCKRLLVHVRAEGVHTIAIDDLHLADADSLHALMPHFAAPGAGPRWLLTTRAQPMPQPLLDWLAQGRGQDLRLDVEPLVPASLHELMASLKLPRTDPALWASALWEHCGGHPLSIIQVLRALHQRGELQAPAPPPNLPIPADVLARAARALDRGDVRAQQLAFIAALAAADFDERLAMRLLRCGALELAVVWRQLQALGIMEGQAFSHELMRQAVLDAVPQHLKPAIHAELAVALTEARAAPAALARHWEEAKEWALAAREGARAARVSLQAGLFGTARQRWHHAADLFDKAGFRDESFDLRYQAGRLTMAAVSPGESMRNAKALLDAAASVRSRAQAWCLVAEMQLELYDQGALASARAALALAQTTEDRALCASARLYEAAALRVEGQSQAALALLQDLAKEPHLLDAHDQEELQGHVVRALADCGRRHESAQMLMGLLAAARSRGDKMQVSTLANYTALQLSALCRVSEALEMARLSRSIGAEGGMDEGHLSVDDLNIAVNLADLGQFAAAIQVGQQAVKGLRAAAHWGSAISAGNLLSSVYITLGRLDLAAQQLGTPDDMAPTWARAMRAAAQGRLAHARGQSALPGLQQAHSMMAGGGVRRSPEATQRLDLELARHTNAHTAGQYAAGVVVWAQNNEHPSLHRFATMIQIEALTRLGDAQQASALADALATAVRAQPEADNLYLPELWWVLVQAWDAAQQPERALQVAREAIAWIENRCLHHVPEVFKHSFLGSNPINRALIQRARR